ASAAANVGPMPGNVCVGAASGSPVHGGALARRAVRGPFTALAPVLPAVAGGFRVALGMGVGFRISLLLRFSPAVPTPEGGGRILLVLVLALAARALLPRPAPLAPSLRAACPCPVLGGRSAGAVARGAATVLGSALPTAEDGRGRRGSEGDRVERSGLGLGLG